jgi:basic membrane protein A
VYGFDTPNSTGAELKYSEARAFNAKVPDAVVGALKTIQGDIASGKLKLKPTKEDARGGKA